MNDKIIIKGARENNLKNINLELPKNKLIIMTGLSGSGKTSLAFDTIYAEGQRRYVESLSSYARQFLGGLEKPDVDLIEGLSPAIAIDQKTTSNNPRSTVGTITEIYDYLRLLYARCGVAYCPIHNKPINASSVDNMVDKVMMYEDGKRLEILAPVFKNAKGSFKDYFDKLRKQGFVRVYVNDEMKSLDEEIELNKNQRHSIEVVIDRLVKKEGIQSRVADSLEIALKLADGNCIIKNGDHKESFSSNFSCSECGFTVPNLEPRLFSFNSPLGACACCKGIGVTFEVDEDILFEDSDKSISQGGIKYYKNTYNTANLEWQHFKALLDHYNISVDKPIKDMTGNEIETILYGSKEPIKYTIVSGSGRKTESFEYIEGVKNLIERRYHETSSEFAKEIYASYMSENICRKCKGKRLNDEVLSVKINDLNIYDFTAMSIGEAYDFIQNIKLSKMQQEIAKLLLHEITSRLKFLCDVGLDYITLNRVAGSLSGGEAQRIRLATQIGSTLTGVLYVLDEPSIGLHQKDNAKLISTLKKMRDLGNTVIVVEHDNETMMESDYLVDIGPGAGIEGGNVVASGPLDDVLKNEDSITAAYLTGRKEIKIPSQRRKGNGQFIEVIKSKENNLKDVSVKFPLGKLIAVTGVSGSGKSTLVNEVLVKGIMKNLNRVRVKPGKCKDIKGLDNIDKLIAISQDPIGRTPRSNPATYTKVFDDIRDLFASSIDAKEKGFTKSRFSFNVQGGRCEACMGDGVKKISMLFVPDVYVKCNQCNGQRYNRETLEVKYNGKTIYDVLKMNVKQALEFFKNHKAIKDKLQILYDVGLSYIELGQSAPTLSGGEAQRIKLASELQKKATGKTIYVLDEPTTGLHNEDVSKLLQVINRIVDNGDTVLTIEHNLDVIKCADHIIDLGPDGGIKGGTILVTGTPEDVAKCKESYTGQYLKGILSHAL